MVKLDVPFHVISEKLYNYICSLYQPSERFPYPLQLGQKGTLYGTIFSCFIAYMLGKEHEMPGRDSIISTIVSLRDDATGLFIDPDVKREHYADANLHSELYVNLQVTSFCYGCLDALGVFVDKRMQWLESLLGGNKLEDWLTGLDWKNPWLVSNLDMFVGNFLLQWHAFDPKEERIRRAVQIYFKWHDLQQDHFTGFWGEKNDLLNAMAGAYHIYLHYDFLKRPIQHVEKIVDATLSLVCRDGLFVYGGGGGSCEDMDAIDILIRCSLLSSYRGDDVKKILLNAAAILATGQTEEGGFSWRVQPNLLDILKYPLNKKYVTGKLYSLAYKALHRSHYASEHLYSSLKLYPYKINIADTWSSWFRPLSLAFIAKRYPNNFSESCNWRFPTWPGLGFNPFLEKTVSANDQ